MTFQPVIPFGGLPGWAFLQRTSEAQRAAFDASPVQRRDEDYFRARIGQVETAEQLVGDRRLLKVALEAYGLGADINNKAFIRKVLEDGTLRDSALSNRLADRRYREFSAAFGFGDFRVPRTKLSDFADKVLSAWRGRSFETAVGQSNNDMRLALNAQRELPGLASGRLSDDAKWFSVMGNAPLRQLFERAFGLPASFGALDLDRQLATFRSRAEAAFGSGEISQFANPDRMEALTRRFLTRSDATATGLAGSNAALQLISALPSILRRA